MTSMMVRIPTVKYVLRSTSYAPRPASLTGLRVGFLDGWTDHRGGMYPRMTRIKEVLEREYDIAGTVWQPKHPSPGMSSPLPMDMMDAFAAQVDVVVNGQGLCGSCTASTINDALTLETMGKPTVTIVQTRFQGFARTMAGEGGLPDLPMLIEATPDTGNINREEGPLSAEDLTAVLAGLLGAANGAAERDLRAVSIS